MKLYFPLLASVLLATLFSPALFAEPCAAAFIPGNNITLERDGMTWDYDEQVTENDAIFFRVLIDETGNYNGFVNAWEILKMEVLLSDKMRKAIEEESDVKLNETSDTVEVEDIEFFIPKEALGRTDKSSVITNCASVAYSFKEEAGAGTTVWLAGTPDSHVTIILPEGLDAELTEGLDNKKYGFENNRTVLRGNFSSEKNIILQLSKNESSEVGLSDMEVSGDKIKENVSEAGENTTPGLGKNTEIRQLSEFLKNITGKISQK